MKGSGAWGLEFGLSGSRFTFKGLPDKGSGV